MRLPAADSIVSFDNVEMRYADGPPILRNVSFDIQAHSFHFLTGRSGAGKSSLLRMMYLALRPTRGQVSLFGRHTQNRRPRDIASIRRRIGIVFQDFRLINHLSVLENVALPLRIAGVRDQVVRAQAGELLEWVGLSRYLDALPPALSGGQQQRVAIARAVINRPALLLADEPTGNVDDRLADRLLYLFEQLHSSGTTILIATHNERMVSRFTRPRLMILGETVERLEIRADAARSRASDLAGR